jgi:hypothetical protein
MCPGRALIVQGPEEALFRYLTPISEKFEEAVREKIDLRGILACHCDIEQSRELGTWLLERVAVESIDEARDSPPDEEFVATSRANAVIKWSSETKLTAFVRNSS